MTAFMTLFFFSWISILTVTADTISDKVLDAYYNRMVALVSADPCALTGVGGQNFASFSKICERDKSRGLLKLDIKTCTKLDASFKPYFEVATNNCNEETRRMFASDPCGISVLVSSPRFNQLPALRRQEYQKQAIETCEQIKQGKSKDRKNISLTCEPDLSGSNGDLNKMLNSNPKRFNCGAQVKIWED